MLSWRLSNTMGALFCVAALEDALARYGNTGDLQYRPGQPIHQRGLHRGAARGWSARFDGRARTLDGQCVHRTRLGRSLKYEEVYLKGYADGREAKAGIGECFAFYNEQRLHQALGYRADGRLARGRGTGSPWTCGQRLRVDHMPTGATESAAD